MYNGIVPPAEKSVPQEFVGLPAQSVPQEDRTFPKDEGSSAASQKQSARKRLTAIAAVLAAAGITTVAGTALASVSDPAALLQLQETTPAVTETISQTEETVPNTTELLLPTE